MFNHIIKCGLSTFENMNDFDDIFRNLSSRYGIELIGLINCNNMGYCHLGAGTSNF